MIKVIIDAEGKIESKFTMTGDFTTCKRESVIALIEICEALSEATGNTFDDILKKIVLRAKVTRFFRDKEREQHEDRA